MLGTPLCILLTLLAADPSGSASTPSSRKGPAATVQPNKAAASPRPTKVASAPAKRKAGKEKARNATGNKGATAKDRSRSKASAPAKNASATAKGRTGNGNGKPAVANSKTGTAKRAAARAETETGTVKDKAATPKRARDRAETKTATATGKGTASGARSRSAAASTKSASAKATHASGRAAPSGRQAESELGRARDLLREVKQDSVRRRYKHEWEKAIRALERSAKGSDRAPALLEAARARYALYRFSSDEADRDRALSLAKKARSAGARDADTFIAAVRREAGDDRPVPPPPATRPRAKPEPAHEPEREPAGAAVARPATPGTPGGHAEKPLPPAAEPPTRTAGGAEAADEPPDTDPVLDRILAQLAEDPREEGAFDTMSDEAPAASDTAAGDREKREPEGAPGALASTQQPGARAPTPAGDATHAGTPTTGDAKAARAPTPAGDATHAGAPASAGKAMVAAPAPHDAPAPGDSRHAQRPGSAAPASDTATVAVAPILPDAQRLDLPRLDALASEGASGPIRKIVIDPGHGGHDTGAIGPSRVREKDVVLAIAKRLARKLRADGYEVVLTREDDRYLALAERTALANAHQGDLFVSVHANAHPRRDRQGVETWVLDVNSDRYSSRLAARENGIVDDADSPLDVRRILADLDAKVSAQASRRLARVVQQEVTGGIRSRFGPVRDLGVKSALFYVLLGARMPAVLVETSFISNRAEEKRLSSGKFQEEVASALVRAIGTFAAQQARIAAR